MKILKLKARQFHHHLVVRLDVVQSLNQRLTYVSTYPGPPGIRFSWRALCEHLAHQRRRCRFAAGTGYGGDGRRAELTEETTFSTQRHPSRSRFIQKGSVERNARTDKNDLAVIQQVRRVLTQH